MLHRDQETVWDYIFEYTRGFQGAAVMHANTTEWSSVGIHNISALLIALDDFCKSEIILVSYSDFHAFRQTSPIATLQTRSAISQQWDVSTISMHKISAISPEAFRAIRGWLAEGSVHYLSSRSIRDL